MPSKRNQDQPTVLDAVGAIIYSTMMEIAGIRVGKVTVAYPDGTVDVQPVRLRKIFGQPQPEQLVSRAPVGWWRAGGMVFVGDLEVGDQVLIVNLQRDFSAWWLSGLVALGATERMHDPADVIILPWLQSLVPDATVHGGPAIRLPTTFRLGRVDNTAGITMWPSKVVTPLSLTLELEGGPAGIKAGRTATSFALKGTEIAAICGTPAGPPLSIAFILNAVPAASDPATVITLANANKAAILALCAALVGNLTVKLVVE